MSELRFRRGDTVTIRFKANQDSEFDETHYLFEYDSTVGDFLYCPKDVGEVLSVETELPAEPGIYTTGDGSPTLYLLDAAGGWYRVNYDFGAMEQIDRYTLSEYADTLELVNVRGVGG